jgi:phosphate:Na+ symporter
MTEMVFQLLGGIGLFLMGMVLLTDGLKAFAGEALRGALVRFTGTPFKAFTSGALVTLLVQSSSATTVTVIGFVSAGLLAFPQAVGVVFGASLGTTGTGWIVSVLGLKVSIGFYALPLVGLGALMKLLAASRWRPLGVALAGFGLIFIGIDTLQQAMQGLADVFNLAALPSSGLTGHVLAMLIGTLMTVIMQSSSAAVATILTALHAGAVNFEQAASLVIGAAVGTTITGALAAIGGTTSAKRTALAHILFNLATGLIAVVMLPLFLLILRQAQELGWLEPGAVSLAAFHTGFIAVGVALFFPFIGRFSRFIERLLPERESGLVRHLDDTLLSVPAVALEATRRALTETACVMMESILDQVEGRHSAAAAARRADIKQALLRIGEFFARIPPLTADEPLSHMRVAQMHAIDHLTRLKPRLKPDPAVSRMLGRDSLGDGVKLTCGILTAAVAGLRGSGGDDWADLLRERAATLAGMRRKQRPAVLEQTATGESGPGRTLDMLDAMRWLDRVGYHAWRASHYLGGPAAPPADGEDASAGPDD